MNIFLLIFSVVLGTLLVMALKPTTKVIQILLAFSGAYLLSITALHLLPEVFETGKNHIGVYILLGVLIQTVLEFFSKGAEHGHIHSHPFEKGVPWLLLLSLCLHAFLEGIPLGNAQNHVLLWAIVVHKIPVSTVLYIFLIHAKLPVKYIFGILTVFALMSPAGLLFSEAPWLIEHQAEITAVIIGVFLHISAAILFESSQNHQFNIRKFVAVLLGFFVAFISTQLH
ncbi:MAG: ZIP family metal transporter [Flavobacteriaceae bacterium]|nr:ZIP family metal transporter [Flavobacteriaceae bacterium]